MSNFKRHFNTDCRPCTPQDLTKQPSHDKSLISRIKARFSFRPEDFYSPTSATDRTAEPESTATTEPSVNQARNSANELKARVDELYAEVQQQALQAEADDIMPDEWSESRSASKAQFKQALQEYDNTIWGLLVTLQEDRDSRFPHRWNLKAELDCKIEIEVTRRKHNEVLALQSEEREAEEQREAKILRREYESKEACECGDRHVRAHWAYDRYGLRKV